MIPRRWVQSTEAIAREAIRRSDVPRVDIGAVARHEDDGTTAIWTGYSGPSRGWYRNPYWTPEVGTLVRTWWRGQDRWIAPISDITDVSTTEDPVQQETLVAMLAKLTAIETLLADGPTEYQEDTAHVDGDYGPLAMHVRNDLLTTLTTASGKYSPAAVDPLGRAYITTNVTGTALASAARTATVNSADINNLSALGGHFDINVTARTAPASIVLKVQGKDSISGTYYDILASAAIVATGFTTIRVRPGLAPVANVAADDILPRIWRIRVEHATADSITYSVSYSIG